MEGSGYRTPPALVRRADGQTIQLTALLYRVLEAVDGRRTHEQIAHHVTASTDRLVTAEDVAVLIEKQLLPLGLLRLVDGSQPRLRRSEPLLGLRFRYVVTDPELTRRITAPFARLFHPIAVALLTVAFAAVVVWVLTEKGLASATHQALYEPELLLTVLVVTVLSAGFHEFGHAAAARYGGATPGAMGTGLYLVWPAFYTDVTDSYRLGRAGRVRTDLGGLYFNAIVAVAMFGAWWLTRWDAILLVIAAQVLQMLRQLAPLVRFDGYHVLADVTGVPDLYQHIRPTLLGLLPQHWGKPEQHALKTWARVVVSTWVLVVVPVLLATLTIMVIAFPRVAATAWDSMGEQWAMLRVAATAGDVLDMMVRVLSIVAVALPLFGMVYLMTRLLRQVAAGVWRSTAGRPARRAAAILTALAVLAGVGWAWWPEDGRYRPIESYERGTISDALPMASSTGLQEGEVARTITGWPGSEPLPTADEPSLAVVLVPREQGAGEPTPGDIHRSAGEGGDLVEAGAWVFPFNRPPAPGEGDNQALAVNTNDGSTVYDVAFALVWVENETADNVNAAYALASCSNCTTVAVAFQVVLVVGQSQVAPQNLAAAVNYRCISCVTGALAQQLVLTVDDRPSGATARELAALWARIAEYGETLEGRSLPEIRAQLVAFEREIVELLGVSAGRTTEHTRAEDPDPTAGPTATTGTPTATAPANPATGPAPSPSGTPTAPADTAASTVSPSPTEGSPTSEPSPTTGSTDSPSAESPAETTEPTPTAGASGTPSP